MSTLLLNRRWRNNAVNIHIWDTTGQDRFNSIASNYYRKTSGAILVYDLTDRNSFNAIEDWVDQLKNYCDEDPVLLLIGNKADKTNEIEITSEEGEEFGKKINAAFYESSAYTGYNIKKWINKLMKEMLNTLNERSLSKRYESSTKSHNYGTSVLSAKTPTTRFSKQGGWACKK